MKKLLTLTTLALLLTACNTESELQNPETPEEKPVEITYEIRMHSPIEFFGGAQADDWYIPSNMDSDLTGTIAQWDGALFKIEDGQETLLTDSIIDITPELKPNYALLPYNRKSSGNTIIVNSVLPDTDNPNTTLFVYNPDSNQFESFTSDLNSRYSTISPDGTKVMFANQSPDSINIIDLENATVLKKIPIEGEQTLFVTPDPNSYSGEIEPDAFGQIHDFHWLDNNTFEYYTYDQNLNKSPAQTINL